MSVETSTLQVPNPYAPLAWVTPPEDRNLMIKLLAVAGALAVLIWDILLHLSQDYKMLRKYRINVLTIVYFFARLSTLAYILGLTIATTAPIGNCNLIRYINFMYPFSVPFSVLPFIPRVSAIYHNNKYVFGFFTFTWLLVIASSILWPFGVVGQKIGTTNYCVEKKLHTTASIAALCLFVHDTLIFLATSWAFMSQAYMDNSIKGILKSIVLGKNLPQFTRSILRDGQAYYLASLILHLLFLSQYYVESPYAFPCSFGNPAVVLIANMSAYVYRNIRLGYFRDYTMTTSDLTQAIPSDRPQVLSIVFKKDSTIEPGPESPSDGHRDSSYVVETDFRQYKATEKEIVV